MKPITRIALILFVGIGSGILIRTLRSPTKSGGPGPDDVVYTDADFDPNAEIDVASITNDEPSHPPEDEAWLSRFTLTERSGKEVSSESLLGSPYIVSFFFTRCPSICVNQNKKIQDLQRKFYGQDVKFLAISCDPEFDTPEVMLEYAARFGADKDQWLFLTGDLLYVRRIGAEIFQQHVDIQNHTERFALVDRSGKIEGFYSWSQEVQFEKLEQQIENMLAMKSTKGK